MGPIPGKRLVTTIFADRSSHSLDVRRGPLSSQSASGVSPHPQRPDTLSAAAYFTCYVVTITFTDRSRFSHSYESSLTTVTGGPTGQDLGICK